MNESPLDAAMKSVGITSLWAQLGLPGSPSKSCHSPFRADKGASFSVWTDLTGRDRFKDFATGATGDAVDFLMLARQCDRAEACREIITLAGTGPRKGWPSPLPVRITPPVPVIPSSPVALNLSALTTPTETDLRQLAAARGWTRNGTPSPVALAGLKVAAGRGILKTGVVRDCGNAHPAWFLTDSSAFNAQARRLDGEMWGGIDGYKAKTAKGACASWPIGAAGITAKTRLVMFTEGCPDQLAAFGLMAESLPTPGLTLDEVAPVCMTGAGQRIHPDALPLFAGKKVIVYPHIDDNGAGHKGARVWVRQLHDAGAFVIVRDLTRDLPEDGKDLADVFKLAVRSGKPINLFTAKEVGHE